MDDLHNIDIYDIYGIGIYDTCEKTWAWSWKS
jgi:hypothetical protein